MIELLDAVKRSGKTLVLDNATAFFDTGITAVLSSKVEYRTFLQCLLGEARLQSGQVLYDGENVSSSKLRGRVGFLDADFMGLPDMRVKDTLNFYASTLPMRAKDTKAAVKRCLEVVELTEHARKRCDSLDNLQRKKLGIAKILLGDAEYLFLEEPCADLTPAMQLELKKLIMQVSAGKTVVLFTSDAVAAEGVCDRYLHLAQGQLVDLKDGRDLCIQAQGHVFEMPFADVLPEMSVTAVVLRADGALCRVVADRRPEGAVGVEPTFAEAFLWRRGENA